MMYTTLAILNKTQVFLLATFLVFGTGVALNAQIQLGTDIDGESSGDNFGWSVSLSSNGERLAVGAPYHDGTFNSSGSVYVYEWKDGIWSPLGSKIEGTFIDQRLGTKVCMTSSGDRLAVSGSNSNGNTGLVQVFEYINNEWTQIGGEITSELPDGGFGSSLALSSSGDRLAVGAPYFASDSGLVKVYSLIAGQWTQLGSTFHGQGIKNYTGTSVALSNDGNTLAITDLYDNLSDGYVHVHHWNGTQWEQLGGNINSEYTQAPNAWWGFSTSLSETGRRIVIGSLYAKNGFGLVGGANVFQFEELSSQWVQMGNPVFGEKVNDYFGYSVTINKSGDRIAVGATGNDQNGSSSGHVKLFEWNYGSMNWDPIGASINGEAADDVSGYSISFDSTGNKIAIGARLNDGTNGWNSGHVRVFSIETTKIIEPNKIKQAQFSPNPTTNKFTITNLDNIQKVQVHSITGSLMSIQDRTSIVDLSDLHTGIYLIEVYTDDGVYKGRVMKN